MAAAPSLADIEQLSVAERIQLAEDIWDTIAASPEQVTVTPAQQSELDRRLEAYRQNPQTGAPWREVKNLLTTREQRRAE
jgi:putative addiction module component (TIGR02574 family)